MKTNPNTTTPTESPKHSPLPWNVTPFLTPHEDSDPIGVYRLDSDIQKRFDAIRPPDITREDEIREEKELDAIHAENAANAAFIVEACNNYESLLADREELIGALKALLSDYDHTSTDLDYSEASNKARSLLVRMEASVGGPKDILGHAGTK